MEPRENLEPHEHTSAEPDVAQRDASQDEQQPSHEQRHQRRSSGAESTLSSLPVFQPAKVVPRGDSFSLLSASGASASMSNVVQDSSSLQVDLQVQTANYETILRHFNLRKLPTEKSMAKLPSAVDYSSAGPLHHHFASMRMRSTASSGSARLVVSGNAYSPSSSSRPPRFSLYRSLRSALRQAVGSTVSWLRGLGRPMTPTGGATKLKDFCLFWVYCFQLLYLPIAPTYLARDSSPAATQAHELAMVRINIVLELVYLLDMLATFNTAVHNANHGNLQLIASRKEIAKRYLRGEFARDLLSALPLESIAWLAFPSETKTRQAIVLTHPALFHACNTLRLLRWRNFVRAAQSTWIDRLAAFLAHKCRQLCGVHCVLVRTIAKMFAFSLGVAHYCTCGWRAIVEGSRDAGTTATLFENPSLLSIYLKDARHVLLVLAGGGVESGNPAEDAYAIVLMLEGVLFFSCVIGNISMLIATANYSSRVEYERKRQALASKMAKLQLPEELQERIYRYYEHLWTEYDATHEDITDFTKDLTRPLALEVGLCRYMNLVICVSFWTDCSPDFVSAVVLNLCVRVYLPDDYIVRKGEIGTEFFMIHRGVSELTGFHRETARLVNGATFGEVALLLNCKRATSVRALTYMEICVLPRKAFQEILARYHSDRRRVVLRILRRGLESNEHPQLWQEVLLRRAHAHGDHDNDTKRLYSQAAGELNDQNVLSDKGAHTSGKITAADGAEILADAMELTIGNREFTSTPSSVSDGFLGWSASDPQRHGSRRNRKQRVQAGQSTSSCSSAGKCLEKQQAQQQETSAPALEPVRSPTTQDATAESVAAGAEQQASEQQCLDDPHAGVNAEARDEQLELLRSLTVLMTRMEDKLSHVEEKVARLEAHKPHQLSHSDSIGSALIAVTVPSYSRASDDMDVEPSPLMPPNHAMPSSSSLAAHCARTRTAAVFDGMTGVRYEYLTPEHPRRALSLDVGEKQHLSRFHEQRSSPDKSDKAASTEYSPASGEEPASRSRGAHQSASFRLQPRRASKSTLADQLWRKNSSPSE